MYFRNGMFIHRNAWHMLSCNVERIGYNPVSVAFRAGGPRMPDQGWTLPARADARPKTGSCPAQAYW